MVRGFFWVLSLFLIATVTMILIYLHPIWFTFTIIFPLVVVSVYDALRTKHINRIQRIKIPTYEDVYPNKTPN